MRNNWLAILDTVAVLMAALTFFLSWLYLPRELFGWGVLLAVLFLVLAGYLNLRHLASRIIEARRKASGRPGPGPKRLWLALLNFVAAIVIIAIIGLFWFYVYELMGWGIRLAIMVLLIVCLVNWWNLAVDYVDAGKPAK